MTQLLAVILALVMASSFIMLGAFVIAGVVLTALTLWRARRESDLAEDLDKVLSEIVGPRSNSLLTPSRPRSSGHSSR